MTDSRSRMTAESFLSRLADRGVEYLLANAGTDFAPIIEALSRNPGTNRKYPRVITVPHENVAVSMAHGYYRVSGKPAMVMVHVTVGTANAVCGLMNAARDNVPVILGAGRTPLTETGHAASRNRSIHWGQEMFDQGSLTREFVKWDYELRAGQPVASVVDRALDHRHVGTARTGLPHAAARSAGRPRDDAAPRYHPAPRRERASTVAAGDRGSRGADRAGGVPADPHVLSRPDARGDDRARSARPGFRASGGAVGGARREPADRSPHVSRLRCRSASRQSRCGRGVRQRGAVDSAAQSAQGRGQGDLPRTRSAVHALSVPRIRGRPFGDGQFARRLRPAARGAARTHEGQRGRDRGAAQGGCEAPRGDARKARQDDRPGQEPEPDPSALSRPLRQRVEGQGRDHRQRTWIAGRRP